MRDPVSEILYALGVTANYQGYFYAVTAVQLAFEEPSRLTLVTKELYPEVAKRYHSNSARVERNLRRVVTIAWETNREYIQDMAGYPMASRPSVSHFIAILTAQYKKETAMETRYGQLALWPVC